MIPYRIRPKAEEGRKPATLDGKGVALVQDLREVDSALKPLAATLTGLTARKDWHYVVVSQGKNEVRN